MAHGLAPLVQLFDCIIDLFPRLHERLPARAGVLSGGEQQMLAIGLMAKPSLILYNPYCRGHLLVTARANDNDDCLFAIKPVRALIDQVRIMRDCNDVIIECADPEISGTRLTIGPQIASMTNREIVDVFNGMMAARAVDRFHAVWARIDPVMNRAGERAGPEDVGDQTLIRGL